MVHKRPTVDDLWSFPPSVTESPGRRSLRVGERTDPQVCPKAQDGCRRPEPLPPRGRFLLSRAAKEHDRGRALVRARARLPGLSRCGVERRPRGAAGRRANRCLSDAGASPQDDPPGPSDSLPRCRAEPPDAARTDRRLFPSPFWPVKKGTPPRPEPEGRPYGSTSPGRSGLPLVGRYG